MLKREKKEDKIINNLRNYMKSLISILIKNEIVTIIINFKIFYFKNIVSIFLFKLLIL